MKAAALLLTLFVLSIPQSAFAVTSDIMEHKAERKEAKAELKENIQARKAAFKEKIQALKDENKKVIAEKLDTRLATINKNRTDKMTANLTKLSDILDQLEAKKDEEKAEGNDVAAVEAALASAETALDAAETAVTTQAGNDYTATVTGDTTLKQNFGTVVSKLRTDLAATHKTVVDAKQAVRAVATALKKLGADEYGETSPSIPVPSH